MRLRHVGRRKGRVMHMELKRKFEFDINSAVKIGVTVLIVAVLIISAKLLMDYNEAVRERELKERIIAELELQRDELEYEYNLEFDRDYDYTYFEVIDRDGYREIIDNRRNGDILELTEVTSHAERNSQY